MIARAAGTSALNITTYLDMAARARSASTTPEQSVQRLADLIGVDLGEGEQAEHRKADLRQLLGYATGMAARVCYGLLARRRLPGPAAALALTALAMVGSTAPMTLLGITDPRRWTAAEWAADLAPHLTYGAVAPPRTTSRAEAGRSGVDAGCGGGRRRTGGEDEAVTVTAIRRVRRSRSASEIRARSITIARAGAGDVTT